jgi:uncharacterized protein
MDHERYADDDLRAIFDSIHTIAVVGASPDPVRPSHGVMRFLQARGYRVIPVNPMAAGATILGEPVRSDLAAVAEPVDMVDLFRRSDAVDPIVAAAIAKGVKVVWMQLGVRNDAAARRARAAGLRVVMDRCAAIEYSRLYGRGEPSH